MALQVRQCYTQEENKWYVINDIIDSSIKATEAATGGVL